MSKNTRHCERLDVPYVGSGVGKLFRRGIDRGLYALFAAVVFLLIPFFIMNAIKTDPAIAEWWTRNIARVFERIMGALTSWLPFSIFELAIVAVILTGITLFVYLIIGLRKRKFRAVAEGALCVVMAGVLVLDAYTLSMGFGYYRASMPLPQAGADYKAEQVVDVAEYFLEDYNALCEKFERDENGCVVNPYGFRGTAERLRREFARLSDGYFSEYAPIAKPIVNSWLMSSFLITGITFLPTGEANVNTDAPPCEITCTMAHELAHTVGVQREGDANLLSQYVLLSSDDDYLRYCGYYDTFGDMLSSIPLAANGEAEYMAEYRRLSEALDRNVSREQNYAFQYWLSQPDVIGSIGEFFNDMYLKLNGATNGTGSYNEGHKTEIIKPVDPDTGEPIQNPETGKPVFIPVYSMVQKIYFYLYEQRTA